MTTIYFVRHGDYKNPKGIVPWRLKGFPLLDKGRAKIKQVASLFRNKNINVIYSSPILRAWQSAKIIGEALHMKVKKSLKLTEVESPFQGYKKEYLSKVIKNIYRNDFHKNKGGESIDNIYKRMNQLITKVLKTYKGKNIVLSSHGDPIMIYILKREGLNFNGDRPSEIKYIPMGGVIRITFENERVKEIREINY